MKTVNPCRPKECVRRWVAVLAIAFTCIAPLGSAATYADEIVPLADFIESDPMIDQALSPGGRRHALVRMSDQGPQVIFRKFDGRTIEVERHATLPQSLFGWAYWVDEARLLVGYTLISIDRKGKPEAVRQIDIIEASTGLRKALLSYQLNRYLANGADDFLDSLADDPDHVLLSYSVDSGFYPSVSSLHLESGETTEIEPARDGVEEWIVDRLGNIRIGAGWGDDGMVLYLRSEPDAQWEVLHDHPLFKDGHFEPIAFDLQSKTFYVKSPVGKARQAIYSFDLSSKAITSKVFEHERYDAGGLFMAQDGRLLAASYVADKTELVFFDEGFKDLVERINALLPGRTNIPIELNDEEDVMIIYSSNESSPERLYLFDIKSDVVHLIVDQNPALSREKMSTPLRVDYFARDGLSIPAYLTLPAGKSASNLPAVVMPHGGPWVRDTLSFDIWAQFLASRGYAVLQPNYRSSTGFGMYFMFHGFGEWGKAMQDDVDDGADWLVSEGIADPDRICIVGGSYGGYAALMGAVRDNSPFKCAIAFAPVTDLTMFVDYISDAPGGSDILERITTVKGARGIKAVSPYHLAKKTAIPVLLAHGDHDIRVLYKHSEKMARVLERGKKEFDFISFEGGSHMMLQRKHREIFLSRMEQFLDRYIGAQGSPN